MGDAYLSLHSRVCIVTGGSRGLGLAMAQALLDAKARVVVTGRTRAALDEAAADFAQRAGKDRFLCLQADSALEADATRVIAETVKAFGEVSVLVNNAAFGMTDINEDRVNRPLKFWEIPPAGWQAALAANVNGPFLMARAAVPHMLARKFGRIVNLSTSSGTMVRQGFSPYGPTKAALEAATNIWAQDLAGTGITCNVLAPGGMAVTRMIKGSEPPPGQTLLEPSVMGPPILFLASDESAKWTGRRFLAKDWDTSLPPEQAATKAASPATDKAVIV